MLTLALLVLSQTPQHRLFQQPNLPRSSLAFFEAFGVGGQGTTTACSTTAPTGARGEVLTFTRASNGTCTKTASGGLATTGIADGDLVVLSSNVARVEYDSNGVLGLLEEATRTNLLFQYLAIDTAVTWTDVGTPTLTTGQTDPLGATGAVQIEDNDAGAFEGRAQSVAVVPTSAYFMHCYVKAGTRAEARISIDGTTQDITGLSATTWSIVEKADASASGALIPVQVLVGDAVGDTGTVIFGGCQVELGAYRTSIIPTTTIAVARAAEGAATFSLSTAVWDLGSASFSFQPTATGATVGQMWFTGSNNARIIYGSGTNVLAFDGTNNPSTAAAPTVATVKRYWASWSTAGGWVVRNATDANQATSAFTVGTWADSATLGLTAVAGLIPDGIMTRVCLDPDTSRCR